MARRTKAEKFDIEVEAALEQALNIDFDDALEAKHNKDDISGKVNGKPANGLASKNIADGLLDMESLEEQITQAAEEFASHKISEPQPDIDYSPAPTMSAESVKEDQEDVFSTLHGGPLQAEATSPRDEAVRDILSHLEESAIDTTDYKDEIEEDAGSRKFSPAAAVEPVLHDDIDHAGKENQPTTVFTEAFEEKTGQPAVSGLAGMSGAERAKVNKNRELHTPHDRIYPFTTVLSLLWIVSGIAAAYYFFPHDLKTVGAFLSSVQGLVFIVGVIVPVLAFWGFAHLAKRSRELQQAVHTMAGATSRLFEPDATSKEQVANLGFSIRREVTALDEGIARTMSRVGELEALLQSEVHNLEQAYSENETRIRTLIVELANEREAVATHADHVKATLIGAQNQMTQEFSSIAGHINTTAETFTSTLSETLNIRWGELVNEFNNVNEGASVQLSERIGEIVQSFDSYRGHFFEELDSRVAEIEKHSGLMEQKLRSSADRVLDNFDTKFQQLDDAIIDRGNQSLTGFGEHIEKLENRARDLQANFDGVADIAIEAFENRLKEIDVSLGKHSSSLIHSVITRTDAIEESANKLSSALETHVERMNETFQLRTRDIASTLTSGRDGILSVLDETKSNLSSEMESVGTTISQLVDEKAGGFINQLAEGRERLGYTLQSETARIVDTVEKQIDTLSRQVTNTEDSLLNRLSAIDEAARGHMNALDERTVVFEENVARNFDAARLAMETQAQNMDMHANTFRDSLSFTHERLAQSIQDNDESLKGIVQNHLQSLENQTLNLKNVFVENELSLDMVLSNHSQIISDRATALQDNLIQSLSAVDEKLEQQGQRFDKRAVDWREAADRNNAVIEDAFLQQTSVIDERTQTMQKALEIGVHNVKSVLENNALSLSETLRERIAEVSGAITSEATRAESMLASSATQLGDSVMQAVNEAEQKLSDRSYSLRNDLQQIGETVNGSMNSLEERISDLTRNTTDRLLSETSNLHSLTTDLQTAAAKTSQSLGTLTSYFSDQLKEVTRAAEERLRAENTVFIDNFSSQTESVVSSVQSAKYEIENNVTQLLERLDASSGTIQLSVGNLHESIKEADSRLSNVASNFKHNIGHLAENLTSSSTTLNNDLQRFTNLSQAALGNLQKFSQQFEDHAALLNETASVLDNSNGAFANKLEINQKTLHTLADSLVAKSDEIANVMNSCEQIISDMTKRAEKQAHSSASQLQITLSNMLADASNRFDGATEQIRKSAEEIRDEFVKTRTDLNYGVRSLPSQTKEYTDAMRKAVVEQVEALKELSGIIEESGRVFDISQPSYNNGTAAKAPLSAQPQQQKPAATDKPAQNGGAASAFTAAPADNMAIRLPAAESNTHGAPGAMNGGGSASTKTTWNDADPLPKTASAFSPSVSSTSSQRGWVSDLLARASRDDTDRNGKAGEFTHKAENPTETLNSLSADIVHSIDGNAITHLWQHYRRGQRNISTNRLYTSDGHMVFEKVKHKYALDGEFRRAVGQYITDFERLLGDVTKNGGSNDSVRDYLISDTGKVYTMLAHVSGRIQ